MPHCVRTQRESHPELVVVSAFIFQLFFISWNSNGLAAGRSHNSTHKPQLEKAPEHLRMTPTAFNLKRVPDGSSQSHPQ